MGTYRAAIAFPADTALPRDEMQITPHYTGDNPDALAQALKANLIAHNTVGAKPFTITIYDALKAPPSYPLAVAEQTGTVPNTGAPREVTLCLSYYSGFNRPSYRGRLYLPHTLIGGTLGTRPSGAQMQACLDFAQVLSQGLPTAHRWGVFSRKLKQCFTIGHAWVDDEWDIQRSRGMRGTTRLEALVP